jgi:hypothetical protein
MLRSFTSRILLSGLFAIGVGVVPALACQARDFLAVDLPRGSASAQIDALQLAYDDIRISSDGKSMSVDGQVWLNLGEPRVIAPADLLLDPTILEQFTYRYPLEFDLMQRNTPYFDPGRVRNSAFFQAIYFQTEQAARDSLDRVTEPALMQGAFQATRKRNVACQLAAALAVLAASDKDYSAVFQGAGGGFNWRVIAGTSRLSAHSFGIAIDVNAEIGKYWRWTGARAGAVGHYDNAIPESLVTTMERFGFIWGGKWHHFDGMHFEYRPELILYSRMVPD